MLRIFSFTVLGLALVLALPAPESVASPGVGVPTSGPQAGPIEVFTMADTVAGPVGSLVQTTVFLENKSSEPVRVYLSGSLDWPDGSSQGLRYGAPMDLPANGGVLLQALSLVPDDAGSGTGTFTATAIVASVGRGGRSSYPGLLAARDSSPFTLP